MEAAEHGGCTPPPAARAGAAATAAAAVTARSRRRCRARSRSGDRSRSRSRSCSRSCSRPRRAFVRVIQLELEESKSALSEGSSAPAEAAAAAAAALPSPRSASGGGGGCGGGGCGGGGSSVEMYAVPLLPPPSGAAAAAAAVAPPPPRLLVGTLVAARSEMRLRRARVQHVVTVCTEAELAASGGRAALARTAADAGVTSTWFVEAADACEHGAAALAASWPAVCAHIDACLLRTAASGGAVLLHCYGGVSRSVSTAAAFMLWQAAAEAPASGSSGDKVPTVDAVIARLHDAAAGARAQLPAPCPQLHARLLAWRRDLIVVKTP